MGALGSPHGHVLLAALMLVSAGCIGIGGDESSDSGLDTQSTAEVSTQTGGIEGLVTDSAVQPVEEATVTVQETGDTTQTAKDGSFAFSNLQPGGYTLNITKEGFISTEKRLEVSANAVATLEVILTHVPTVEPYTQQFEFKGFLECSVRAGIGVALCSVPNNVLGGNATNDRFLFSHRIEANAWQMVSEMTWEPNSPLAERMSLIVEPEGIANDNRVTFAEAEQAGPIVLNTDRGRFVDVVKNLTEICESDSDDPAGGSNENYCNRDYLESGGSLQLRVFVEGINEVTVPTVGSVNTVGLAVQQEFTVFNTVFYNTPACEEYSLTQDNTCPQQDTPPEQDPYDELSSGGNESGDTSAR